MVLDSGHENVLGKWEGEAIEMYARGMCYAESLIEARVLIVWAFRAE